MPNPYVNLMAAGPYNADMLKLQRQQMMADALRQQADSPIQVFEGGGAQAPISWASVLAKGLSGLGSGLLDMQGQKQAEQMQAADRDRAAALAKQLMGTPANEVGAPNIAPGSTTINATPPQLPGGPAPAPVMAQAQVPGIDGPGASQQVMRTPSTQEQLAMLLAAGGDGPREEAIRSAMLPQVFNRMNSDIERQQGREDVLWKNSLPMSTAAQQTMDAQEKMARAEALFKNQLPMTAAEKAADARGWATLNETRNYHKQMAGMGLGEDGTQSPVVQSWVKNILAGNGTLQNVPGPLRSAVSQALAGGDKTSYSPTAQQRLTLASSRITKPFTDMAAYKLTADGMPYLQRIAAASKHPGSVSDQDLLDSLTKLNTGGNAVTEAQVALITGNGSFKDWAGRMSNKLKNGGALSDGQRQQIRDISRDIYANYLKGYAPVYQQATSQLRAAGVPEAFWTIPDLNKLTSEQFAEFGGEGGKGGAPSKGWGKAVVEGGR